MGWLNSACTRISRVIFIEQGFFVEMVSPESKSTHRTK